MNFHIVHKINAPHLTQEFEHEIRQWLGQTGCGLIEEHEITPEDCIVVLGGDGTFMSAGQLAWKEHCYIAGFNCGNLGFFLENRENWKIFLNHIIEGHFFYNNYSMLEVKTEKDYWLAFNEIMFCAEHTYEDIQYELSINDVVWGMRRDVGILCSTSQGSTAYNKNLGGAMIVKNDSMQITPLVTQSFRPLILGQSNQFIIKPQSPHSRIILDGQKLSLDYLPQNIIIQLSEKKIKHIVSDKDLLLRKMLSH